MPTVSYLLDDRKTLDRLRVKLGSSTDQKASDILLFAPELSDADLEQTLNVALRLEPLTLDDLTAIRIEVEPRAERNGEPLYLHQATAPYQGSRVLWKLRPSPRTVLMLGGKVSDRVLTAEDWLPSKQFDHFEGRIGRLLDEVRAALPLQESGIEAYNAELPEFCAGYVRGRWEEFVGWRRRGEQLRARNQKRAAFESTEPAIDPVIPEWKRYVAALVRARG